MCLALQQEITTRGLKELNLRLVPGWPFGVTRESVKELWGPA